MTFLYTTFATISGVHSNFLSPLIFLHQVLSNLCSRAVTLPSKPRRKGSWEVLRRNLARWKDDDDVSIRNVVGGGDSICGIYIAQNYNDTSTNKLADTALFMASFLEISYRKPDRDY
ncbi:hypothetical protein MLD38_040796 [Melastoma candidum]|nr:hypothetical protein MLD38_040796 [Melastoma candidum]